MKTQPVLRTAAIGFLVLLLTMFSGCDPVGIVGEPTGVAEGIVIGVTSGDGIPDVEISVLDASRYSATSGSDGSFSIEVPVGIQTLAFTKPGFSFPNQEVNVEEGQTLTIPESEIIGNPDLGSGEYRIVLTWGLNPEDLDSHLLIPNGQHVYYVDQSPTGAGANLDVDDVTSYGPETITITSQQTGTYKYYVHRYYGSGALAGSDALVRIFDTEGLLRSFTAPNTGSGDYWDVFTLNGSTVTTVDQIQTTEPTF